MSDEDRAEAPSRERGAILPLMAIVLVVLMGLAAMAVDLGWLFWNSIEIQHGADAAALAGVVYEPDHRTEAYAEALASAGENGYVDAAAETTVTVVDFTDDATASLKESMLRVTITHAVPTFFLTLFGISELDIARTAVAEYVEPLALGSPESYFGDDPARGLNPGFWGQINGSFVAKQGGDRFGAQCLHGQFGSGCAANPEARPVSGWGTSSAQGGYLYGIEVEDSAGLQVEIFDGPVYAIPKWDVDNVPAPPLDPWNNPITGNFAGDIKKNDTWNVKARTWFMLYGPDLTVLDTTDGNELLCSVYYDERVNVSDATNPPISDAYAADFAGWDPSWLEFDQVSQPILDAMWDNMSGGSIADFRSAGCSSSFDKGPGIYLLRVFNEQDPSGPPDWRGANKYSLRVTSAGPAQPAIYGIGDMAISSARHTTKTEFHLARVEQRYAGKDLILELWDVGDIVGGNPPSDNAWFRIVDGTGATVACEWEATNGQADSGSCNINASDKRFNDHLITIVVEIRDDYTCSGDGCWWKIIYNIAGQVKETTTWSAYIDGSPIRLVE
jgi:hypothetical protein